MAADKSVMTVHEVADILRLHPATVYRQIKTGTLPFRAFRIGNLWRINAQDVRRFMETNGEDLPDH